MNEQNHNPQDPPAPRDEDPIAGITPDEEAPAARDVGGEDEPFDEFDPANRSLADALRVSFKILKVVMLALVVLLAVSGFRQVPEGFVGVKLRFGKIVGDPGRQVRDPGFVMSFPEPVDTLVLVPTSLQEVTIRDAFWWSGRELDEILASRGGPDALRARGPLEPGKDGSLITGDKNIVHGRWAVNYRVYKQDAPRFIRNVSAANDPQRGKEAADRIVRFAAERAILHAVAAVAADDFLRANIAGGDGQIKLDIQNTLDELETGITVTAVTLTEKTPPLNVIHAFSSVNEADSEKAKLIEDARREATSILNDTAGGLYPELIEAIDAYERARELSDASAVAVADQQIASLLDSERLGGRAATLIQNAVNYQRSTVNVVRTEAERFRGWMPSYRRNPNIVIDRLWQETRQQILASDVETFYYPPSTDELYLEIDPDPRVERRRQTERFQEQQMAQRPEDRVDRFEAERRQREREREFLERQTARPGN